MQLFANELTSQRHFTIDCMFLLCYSGWDLPSVRWTPSSLDDRENTVYRVNTGPEMAYMIQCIIRPFKAVYDCFIDFYQLVISVS